MSEARDSTRSFLLIFAILFSGVLVFFIFLAFVLLVQNAGQALLLPAGLSIDGGNVGVVKLEGVIDDASAGRVCDELADFGASDSIRAVVLRINSPGGSVAASQEIMAAVTRVREKRGKPVVASMGAVAASGGYYAACAADYVYANPGTITGSIGVIMQTAYMRELMEWARIEPITYKSGPLKDAGSPFRRASPDDEAFLNGFIQEIYGQFLDDVSRHRGIPVEELRPNADGRILSGRQALSLKLVDGLGSFGEAVDKAAELAGIEGNPKLVHPRKQGIEVFRELLQTSIRTAAGVAFERLGAQAL